MRNAAVIIATGIFTDNGSKQLIAENSLTYTERLVHAFMKAGVEDLVILTGYHGDRLAKLLEDTPAVCLPASKEDRADYFMAVKTGLRIVKNRCDRAFVCPVTTKIPKHETLLELMSRKADVVVPVYDGVDGSPLLLSSHMCEWILLYNGRRGVEGACRSLAETGLGRLKTVTGEYESAYGSVKAGQSYYKPVINWV